MCKQLELLELLPSSQLTVFSSPSFFSVTPCLVVNYIYRRCVFWQNVEIPSSLITPKPGGAILLNLSIPIVDLFLRSRGLPAKLLVFIYVHLWFFSSLACKYFLGS